MIAAIEPDNFLDLVVESGRELFIVPPVSSKDPGADPVALAALINQILDNPEATREAVSMNAQAFIDQNFTIDAVAGRHLEVLKELAEEPIQTGSRSNRAG